MWALEGCPLLLQGTAAPALCHELPDLCSVTQFHWLLAMHWEVLKTYVLSFVVYGVLFFFSSLFSAYHNGTLYFIIFLEMSLNF